MTEPTAADRTKAAELLHPGYFTDRIEDVASALAEERERARRWAAAVLRAAEAEQRAEAETVPDTDEGTHADGHRCAADFLARRAAALDAASQPPSPSPAATPPR